MLQRSVVSRESVPNSQLQEERGDYNAQFDKYGSAIGSVVSQPRGVGVPLPSPIQSALSLESHNPVWSGAVCSPNSTSFTMPGRNNLASWSNQPQQYFEQKNDNLWFFIILAFIAYLLKGGKK